MLHTIEIDDSTGTGRNLIALLRDLAKSNKGIHVMETEEDDELLASMKDALASGIAERSEVDAALKEMRGK